MDRASSDLVTFSRGRTMRTADGRGPRLLQRTDTERKETRDGKDRKELLLFLHCFFFLIVHTAEGLGPGSASSFCCNGCLRRLCLRSKAALCCHLAAQARVRARVWAPGKLPVETTRGSEEEAAGLPPSLFLLLSLWASLQVQGTRMGWMDREAGGARARGNGKEAGGCGWATLHELGLLHSFLVRRGVPRCVAGDVGACAAT